MVANQSEPATGNITNRAAVAKVTPSSAHVEGGNSVDITIYLNQPALNGDTVVQLISSNPGIVATPANVNIPAGQASATFTVSTSPVSSDSAVAITALYENTVVGASLNVTAAVTAAFAVAVKPSTLTIAPGHSGSTKITTTVTNGYDHALQLTALRVPAGVSVTFTPSLIPAPGAGTSKALIKVATPGTYSLRMRASDGTTSHGATLTLTVPDSGPGATFQGCWFRQNGHRYQGVNFSVANPGTYPFDAVLYSGTTCEAGKVADEFGFGTLLNFGAFDYTFWFTDFADQTDMSAFWYVGSDKSKCVNYATAPDC